jgi:hypothetical protein
MSYELDFLDCYPKFKSIVICEFRQIVNDGDLFWVGVWLTLYHIRQLPVDF